MHWCHPDTKKARARSEVKLGEGAVSRAQTWGGKKGKDIAGCRGLWQECDDCVSCGLRASTKGCFVGDLVWGVSWPGWGSD